MIHALPFSISQITFCFLGVDETGHAHAVQLRPTRSKLHFGRAQAASNGIPLWKAGFGSKSGWEQAQIASNRLGFQELLFVLLAACSGTAAWSSRRERKSPMKAEVSEVSRKALWRFYEQNQSEKLARKAFQLARRGEDVMRSFSAHPFEDEWVEFARASMNSHIKRCTGYVYAAANPVHVDLHKVGQTGKTIDARLKALVKEGVFGHFELVHSIRVPDRFHAEAHVHQKLALDSQRHKEFFKAPHRTVTAAMNSVLKAEKKLLAELGLDPIAAA